MPGQALSELNTPSIDNSSGTTRVNSLPHSGLRLPMHDTKAITKNDCAVR